ncbi:T9SS type A sorting domain-containing protein, partial [candidate division KSB1 bacterium]|nr:T9SS type A sorting domain-containing protein [candidate division KSB1 bacterium]
DVPVFKPTIFPSQPPLTEDVQILFQVNMTNATNFYTDEAIDPAGLIFVGLKGQNEVLGAWGGDWLPSDTTNGTLHVLNDNGENGDKTAGDNIWSLLMTFPAGNTGGPSLYKYGAHYAGADTINGGYHPLDNEMQGTDHWVNVKVNGTTEVYDDFGLLSPATGIESKDEPAVPEKMDLAQNYPNPFNPVTTIQFTLAKDQLVNLTVHNVLGQKVATLVNKKMTAGSHSVQFNAMNSPSGVYFYKLTSGDVTLTRKMVIMK